MCEYISSEEELLMFSQKVLITLRQAQGEKSRGLST